MKIDKNLTFKHYKEPLREIPRRDGVGYYGAVLMTKDLDKIQCHVCGGVFRSLVGHIKTHDMNTKTYKEKYKLAKKTALVSETFRAELKENTVKWLKTLTEEQKEEIKRKGREGLRKRKNIQPKISLETKNKRGTCPDQLLDQICGVANKLGHTPSKKEFIQVTGTQRYVHLIYKTFGSWTEAVKMAGYSVKEPVFRGYTNKQLLGFLKSYYKQNGTLPRRTDFSRGLLPSYWIYHDRFGGIEKARKIAGIEI